MSPSLTDIERKILDYMVSYLRTNTYQPSIREIGERFGIKSTKTVSEHLQALAEKGFLERDPSRSRGVRILGVDLSPDAISVPVFAELPDDRGSRAESSYTLDRRLACAQGGFLVRVHGDELAVLGFRDGDLLLLEPAVVEEVPDGSLVAVRTGNTRPTFQRFARNGRGVYLQPLTVGSAAVLEEEPARVQIVGRVAGLIRRIDGPEATVSLTAH
jgi:repressor LexA